jgi:hypothetical protein
LENHLAKIEILGKLADRGGRVASPVYYSWVNITCHVSSLQFVIIICL